MRSSVDGVVIGRLGHESREVGCESLVAHLGDEVVQRESRRPTMGAVRAESLGDSFGRDASVFDSQPHVEEIATFAPLVERPDRGEELLEGERGDIGRCQ